ncbi:hypothetical protein EDD11_004388 [Mortierella claussenii]|nr:hypothetical protein EDD11_004388 [Mortierella claussenii]
MSRSIPFEDPLLHPPTPPINAEQVVTAQLPKETHGAKSSLQVDEGPIPFQSSPSVDSPSIFSPQPVHVPVAVSDNLEAATGAAAVTHMSTSGPEKTKSIPDFIDPLAATFEHQAAEVTGASSARGSSSSPNISIPISHNSIPTEHPTHLPSPPLPQRPPSVSGTTFTAFQAFSSALQPPTASGTPASATISGSDALDTSLENVTGLSSLQQNSSTVGLGLENSKGLSAGAGPPVQVGTSQWKKRNSIGVSTNPSRVGLQDQSDMVHQELKSPEQQSGVRRPLQGISNEGSPLSNAGLQQQQQQQYQDKMGGNLTIRPVEHARDHLSGIKSPVFAVPQSPIRQEGFPVLNSHGMFHEITTPDAMNGFMVRHIPAEKRVLRDWNALTEAEQRQAPRAEILHEMIVNNSWRAMARYTRTQIVSTSPERVPELINLWYARLLALVKLGEYEMAQAELDQLGDMRGPQFRYENYPADMFLNNEFQTQEQQRSGALRRGSMIPFELFVLKARLQGHLGDVYEAIDQLYELIIHCKKFEAICKVNEDGVGAQQWHDLTGQLHLMVLNYLVELKDYPAATRYGRDLARAYPQDINFHSGLGRLYLQLGDLERAEEVFNGVEEMVKNSCLEATDNGQQRQEQKHQMLQLSMNKALLAVAQGQWFVAKSTFEEVLAQEPENLAATNNLAVCELYAGQLNEAIPRLERLMFAYPTSAGTSEPLVFNMATLYELRTEGSLHKKQQMLVDVSKWAGDQFNVGVFKM